MSTLKDLKEYLVGDASGYLHNEENNGKTVMLSGAWGAGKTHFWIEEIQPQLDEKKNIYISLYGMESINELKFEILKEAYNLEVQADIISKSASMLSSIAPSFGKKILVDGFEKLNIRAKDKKAEEILKSGSIICLDDFDRKSKKIDLNDLFGYISQLALDYQCKVVIVLNSDVFEGEEASVFKTVKEKTVSKFFYFEPTIDRLFDSIYKSADKYKRLNAYKSTILASIKETEELNARIYIQVLDNCLEWIDKRSDDIIEHMYVLILATIGFIKHGLLLSYPIQITVSGRHVGGDTVKNYVLMDKFPQKILYVFGENMLLSENHFFQRLLDNITDAKHITSEEMRDYCKKWALDNENDIKALWKYGYRLSKLEDISKETYEDIYQFVKTGILLNKAKEQ